MSETNVVSKKKYDLSSELFTEKLKYISEYALNFDNKSIQVYGDLNEDIGVLLRVKYDLLKQWTEQVEKVELKEITLDISSFGGSIYAIFSALDFFHELMLEGVIVNTRAHGLCMSAATVLLAGGTGVRMSLPNCKHLLHDVQIEGVGGTATQVEHTTKQIVSDQLEMFKLYAKFANKGKEEFNEKDLIKEAKRWIKTYTKNSIDSYLSPTQMKDLHLIDVIL